MSSIIQFQFRRGPASQWTSVNPTLADGELAIETDTRQFKIGNGITAWNSLGYGGLIGPTGTINNIINFDMSFNANIFVGGDASFNGRLKLSNDASFNSNLYVGKDLSLGGNLIANKIGVGKIPNPTYGLDVVGGINMTGGLYVNGNPFSSFNANDDLNLNANLFVGKDVSLSGKLYVQGVTTLAGDASLGSNLVVIKQVGIGKTPAINYQLDVSGNINLSGALLVNGTPFTSSSFNNNVDLSLNANLFVGADVSFNSKLYVQGLTTLNNDASLNSNLFIGKDASFGGKLYVADDASFNGNLRVGRDISFGGNLYGNGNIGIGIAPLGKLHIYEATGTAASATTGTLMLEHGDLAGASSLVFRSVGDNSGNEYGYLQYRDRGVMPMSDYAFDLSAGTGTVNNGNTIANTGTVGGSLTANTVSAPTDCSLTWLTNPNTSPYSNITLPSTVLRFGQSNLLQANTTNIAYLSQSITKTSNAFSFTVWIYPYIVTSPNCIFNILDINNSGTSVFNVLISGTQLIIYKNNSRTTNYIFYNTSLSVNTWYHIALIYDGTIGTLYINGTSSGTINGTFTGALNNFNSMIIGARAGYPTGLADTGIAQKGFFGLMTGVTINDYALSAAEVATLYNNKPANATLMLGIENDVTGVGQDSIVLWPDAGNGFVGINNMQPVYPLDVSGDVVIRGNLNANNPIIPGYSIDKLTLNTMIGYTNNSNTGNSFTGLTTGNATPAQVGTFILPSKGVWFIQIDVLFTLNGGSDTITDKLVCISETTASTTTCAPCFIYTDPIDDGAGSAGPRQIMSLSGIYHSSSNTQQLYINSLATTSGSRTITVSGNYKYTKIA